MATPSFIRDPDQAAELAALIRGAADEEDSRRDPELSPAAAVAETQRIARYRRWATELAPEPADAPVQIRPASTFERKTEAG